jgi:hypothetical protein
MHTVWQHRESVHPPASWTLKQLISPPGGTWPPQTQFWLTHEVDTWAICVQLMSHADAQQNGSSAQTAAQQVPSLQYGLPWAMQHGPALMLPQLEHTADAVWTQVASQLTVQQNGFVRHTLEQQSSSLQ